jgi:hypothetical protein
MSRRDPPTRELSKPKNLKLEPGRVTQARNMLRNVGATFVPC